MWPIIILAGLIILVIYGMVYTEGYMEFIAQAITASADSAWTIVEFATPTGRSENIAMLIHKVVLAITSTVDVPTDGDRFIMQLLSRTKATLPSESDPDVIASFDFRFSVLTSGGTWIDMVKEQSFFPPILFSRSKMYVGIYHTGQTAGKIGACKVGYTLEKVPAKEFIAALTD